MYWYSSLAYLHHKKKDKRRLKKGCRRQRDCETANNTVVSVFYVEPSPALCLLADHYTFSLRGNIVKVRICMNWRWIKSFFRVWVCWQRFIKSVFRTELPVLARWFAISNTFDCLVPFLPFLLLIIWWKAFIQVHRTLNKGFNLDRHKKLGRESLLSLLLPAWPPDRTVFLMDNKKLAARISHPAPLIC